MWWNGIHNALKMRHAKAFAGSSPAIDTTNSSLYPERMTKRTKADYESAIANSPTMSGALRILGLKPSGGNFSILKKKAAEYEIPLKFSPSIPLTRKAKTQAIQPSELFVLSELSQPNFDICGQE